MKKYGVQFAVCFYGVFLLSIFEGCSSDDDAKAKLQIPPHEAKLQSYYSASNRGKWSDLDLEHDPAVNVSKTPKQVNISVTAPFTSRPDHYTEMILLTDYSLKEIEKHSYKKTDQEQIKTTFSLPKGAHGEYYVMLKCNLHDMWYKKIVIP